MYGDFDANSAYFCTIKPGWPSDRSSYRNKMIISPDAESNCCYVIEQRP